jgi:hypothetical protein
MEKTTRARLFLFLVLVGVLAGVFAAPSGQVALAVPPNCLGCELRWQNCVNQTCCSSCQRCIDCQGDPECCDNLLANCFDNCT